MDPNVLRLFGVLLAVSVSGAIVYTTVALVNTVQRRFESRSRGPDEEELAFLRDRAELVDQLEHRVAELESRADFAERLLAPPHQAGRAGGPGGAD